MQPTTPKPPSTNEAPTRDQQGSATPERVMDRRTLVKGLLLITCVTLAALAVVLASALYPVHAWIVLGVVTTLVAIASGFWKMIERVQVHLETMRTTKTRS